MNQGFAKDALSFLSLTVALSLFAAYCFIGYQHWENWGHETLSSWSALSIFVKALISVGLIATLITLSKNIVYVGLLAIFSSLYIAFHLHMSFDQGGLTPVSLKVIGDVGILDTLRNAGAGELNISVWLVLVLLPLSIFYLNRRAASLVTAGLIGFGTTTLALILAYYTNGSRVEFSVHGVEEVVKLNQAEYLLREIPVLQPVNAWLDYEQFDQLHEDLSDQSVKLTRVN